MINNGPTRRKRQKCAHLKNTFKDFAEWMKSLEILNLDGRYNRMIKLKVEEMEIIIITTFCTHYARQ